MTYDDYIHDAKPDAYSVEHDEDASTGKEIPGSPPEQNHIPWTAKRMIAILALCTYHLPSNRSVCAVVKQQTLTTHCTRHCLRRLSDHPVLCKCWLNGYFQES